MVKKILENSCGDGNILLQGSNYVMTGNGLQINCEGNTMWIIDPEGKEVIMQSASEGEQAYMDNPVLLFVDMPEFSYGEHGKPFLKNYPDWHFNISHCKNAVCCVLSRENVGIDIEEIKRCVDDRGCVLFKTYRNGEEHFVIITMMDSDFLYIWDSYYLGETYYDTERKISIIFNKPFHYNRKVSIDRFLDERIKDFALGPVNEREVLLFKKMY